MSILERLQDKGLKFWLEEDGRLITFYPDVGASVKVVQNSRRETGPIGARGYG